MHWIDESEKRSQQNKKHKTKWEPSTAELVALSFLLSVFFSLRLCRQYYIFFSIRKMTMLTASYLEADIFRIRFKCQWFVLLKAAPL